MEFQEAARRVGAVAEAGEPDLDERQPLQLRGDVVGGLVPADGLQPVGHRLGRLDQQGGDDAASAVGGVVGGRAEVREPGRLDARAGHGLEGGLDEDSGGGPQGVEIHGHDYSSVSGG